MNRKSRVLLVGRRFWPHGGFDAACHLIQLAKGLQRSGVHVEVMTPRYASSWSPRIDFGPIPVHRPAAAPRSDWSMGRYVRHCTTWLKEHATSFDVVVSDSLREESVAVVAAAKETNIPAIVRHAGHGGDRDSIWLKSGRGAARAMVATKSASQIVCDNPIAQRALMVAGVPAAKLVRIAPGFGPGAVWSSHTKSIARHALTTANSDLSADPDAPVVVCFAPMRRCGPVMRFVESVRFWVARFPDLRVWMIGDGPDRDHIYSELRSDGVRQSIAMPGSFNNIQDLIQAADVFVQLDTSGLDCFFGEAVANELPIVAANYEPVTTMFGPFIPAESKLLKTFRADSAKELRRAVRDAIENANSARSDAAELRRLAIRHRTKHDWIDDYKSLIDSVAANPRERT